MRVIWTTGFGTDVESDVLAQFEDDGVTFVVVRCARGPYDAAEPFTVIRMDEVDIVA